MPSRVLCAVSLTLQKTGIANIFSTPYKRTTQTAQAVAQRSGLQVQAYDPAVPTVLVEKVKSLNGTVLVVGHSNTLPELVRLFGGAPGADLADNEYDRLYQLIADANGVITTVLLTSPPIGAAPQRSGHSRPCWRQAFLARTRHETLSGGSDDWHASRHGNPRARDIACFVRR
jgi:broad specificity phosphatase PhoE